MAEQSIQAKETSTAAPADAVVQFSVFMPNQLGRLQSLVNLLGTKDVHILALTILDTTESSIVRMVVDDPDAARELLVSHDFPFVENFLVVTEVDATVDLGKLMAAFLEAELNINYLYSFIPHPHGKSMLAMSVEDIETAVQTLKRHQFPMLTQADISR